MNTEAVEVWEKTYNLGIPKKITNNAKFMPEGSKIQVKI